MLRIRQVGSNQTLLTMPSGIEVFFSYETPVAVDTGKEILVTDQKFSSQYLDGRKARKVPQSTLESFLEK